MAAQTPSHPRPRRLIALAVLATAALTALVPFTGSDAAASPDPRTSTGWYGSVRASVEMVMDAWLVKAGRSNQAVRKTSAPGRRGAAEAAHTLTGAPSSASSASPPAGSSRNCACAEQHHTPRD